MSRKLVIDPVTRVEGHGKVTILLDDLNKVEQARLHIVEFRGFEKFVQGRPYWEAPVLVQRLCGICPVSHHLCAAKAIDEIVGLTTETLGPTPSKMRRLMHYGQVLQSHALHFFYLAAPDLLLGIDSNPMSRNIVGVARDHRELAQRGILMRQFGQEIIKATAGKKIHGISAVPGGIHKNLTEQEKKSFFNDEDFPSVNTIVDWAQELIDFYKIYYHENKGWIDSFGVFPSNYMSLVSKDGGMDLYHGNLRVIDSNGEKILNDVDYHQYTQFLAEKSVDWSYMKFPYLRKLGAERGWSRVGPLARINAVDFIPTPLAQKRLEEFHSLTGEEISHGSLHYHWARLIEILHCAEEIQTLLNDDDLQGKKLVSKGTRQSEGISFIEAPRGTLIHHYQVDENDAISKCNLIVSTTHNNTPINEAVTMVAKEYLEDQVEITEGMLNHLEVAIRAYDPCLSCATHAVGQMPLKVTIENSQGKVLHEKRT